MEIVLLSSKSKLHSEAKLVKKLFQLGLDTFHVRKPKFSSEEMSTYLSLFSEKHLNKMVLHTHHRMAKKYPVRGVHLTKKHRKHRNKKKLIRWFSGLFFKQPKVISRNCHKLSDVLSDQFAYEYIILTPVFDSISKKGYGASFSERTIEEVLVNSKNKVYAFGGVNAETIPAAQEMGFDGVMLYGSFWKADDQLEYFKAIQNPKVAAQYA